MKKKDVWLKCQMKISPLGIFTIFAEAQVRYWASGPDIKSFADVTVLL